MLLGFTSPSPVESEAKPRVPAKAEEAFEDLTPSTVEPSSDVSDVDSAEEEEEDEVTSFAVEDTIVVFDWDDTILPSTWLQREGLSLDGSSVPGPEQAAQLRALARQAARTLRCAKRLGSVVLVTNAERGWIELSCHKFVPSLAPLLESLKIISARSDYEKLGVTSPVEWKCLAFQTECNSFYRCETGDRKRNVISVGDSINERTALFSVTKDMRNCCTKSLKFMEQPDIFQLQRQHELVSRSIPQIISHDGSLDLRVQVSA
mmetsp:Transcript_39574/g.114208  ORF Transcript_39574/g.114208 Transcript_39574/m.114208 type:complete len:262 (+) Transcript_39574:72-857(+)